jgi:ABC-2 type transport system ATP-binding protein
MSIRTTIRQLADEGMTVLLSSHNMLEIAFLSDRVGLISKGKLHDIGTPKELMEKYKAKNLEEVFLAATK